MVRNGGAGNGRVGHGPEWQGRPGEESCGEAGPGKAGNGTERYGKVWLDGKTKMKNISEILVEFLHGTCCSFPSLPVLGGGRP